MNRKPEDLPMISAPKKPLVKGGCDLVSQTLNTISPLLLSAVADFFYSGLLTDEVEEEGCCFLAELFPRCPAAVRETNVRCALRKNHWGNLGRWTSRMS